MGSFATVRSDVGRRVRLTLPVVSWALGRPKMFGIGQEFQYVGNRRSSLGGYLHFLAFESYDPYLGLYTTPDSPRLEVTVDHFEFLEDQ